jgi:hypothetical protein
LGIQNNRIGLVDLVVSAPGTEKSNRTMALDVELCQICADQGLPGTGAVDMVAGITGERCAWAG